LTPPINDDDDAYAVVCFVSFSGGVVDPEPADDSELVDAWWPGLLSAPPALLGVRGDCIIHYFAM